MHYEEIRAALAGEKLPCAFVDLDAFDRNVDRQLAILRPRKTPMRVATKSIRVAHLIDRVLQQEGTRGLMCFDIDEAVMLAKEGFDDFLIAYPTLQPQKLDALAELARDGRNVSIAIDSIESATALDRAGTAHDLKLRAVLCLDMALEKIRGRVHLGVRRSPLRTPEQSLTFARSVRDLRGVVVHGILGYEAQVAGMGDESPFDPKTNRIKRWIRNASMRDVKERRAAIVDALKRDGFDLAIINGGGTGSLDSTTPDTGVNEVAVGSGFFKPHLFDYYSAPYMHELEPAAFFALEIVRRASPTIMTCGGGGYVASGSASPDKLPLPWLPRGLHLLSMEGAGEVQTPIDTSTSENPLEVGDAVVFRHAKAGELMERFREVLLLQNARVMDRVPTYRGSGFCFL